MIDFLAAVYTRIAVRLRPRAKWLLLGSLGCFVAMALVPGLSFGPVLVRTTLATLFLLLFLLFTVVINFHPATGVFRSPTPLEDFAPPGFVRLVKGMIVVMLAAFFLTVLALPFVMAAAMHGA